MLLSQAPFKQLRLWALGATVATLFGCAGAPVTTAPTPSATPVPSNQLLQQASEAEAEGNYIIAAQSYLQLADQSLGAERHQHLLSAARLLQRGRLNGQAEATIAQINVSQLSASEQIQLRFIQARIALQRSDAEQALAALKIDVQQIGDEQRPEWHRLRAEAYGMAGNHLEEAREYVMLEPFLSTPEAINSNHEQIWTALHPIAAPILLNLRSGGATDILSGWMELSAIYKTNLENPEGLREALVQWQIHYPAHPADRAFLDSLFLRQYAELDLPDKIALLLPLSGNFAAPAKAVRDGFLGAYYARNNPRYNPQIRIYDTGGDLVTGLNAYHQAIAEGANLVVGPLNKALLEHLAQVTEFAVPTLALNYLSHTGLVSENLYQYGLLPEDEARQVAERAWLEGYNKALVLAPAGEWGDRMLTTFSDHWQKLDGELLETQRYDASKHDFAHPVVSLLNIDESQQRHQDLENLLGTKLKFEPRRRQDIDFIYVAAFPSQARQIRPQLKFYYAGDIPVFSTSHLYTGEPDPTLDRDMDGIQFCDMPWVFNGQQKEALSWHTFTDTWGAGTKPYKRLYAMGIDAFNLIGRLKRLAENPEQQLAAESGRLYLDDSNRVHRQLEWARFVSGKPRRMDPAQFSQVSQP